MTEDVRRPLAWRRRRRNSDEGPRNWRTVIKHTDDEYAVREAMARTEGVTRAQLYERALMAGSAVEAARLATIRDELYGVRRVLAGVAVNLNQMAKATNATHELPANFEGTVTGIARLVGRLEAIAGQVERDRL